ncbi:DUF302 domain-containing protein [Dyadobacter sp. CY345]|uniref:DUF302 domain-containing protein n=1 Tax=Dyadobacter sp. CY345 TaxID=2909335 RepID=UPI001F1E3F5B|nr:DUF302 domain-containing protein [Dyadobacter sp. CY345]MCF2446667.1 DUF302 domain-containing protein [Dyadobacter sp. CY345]
MENYDGVIIRPTDYSVEDATNRLVILLQNKGATIYARINQQTESYNAGQKILPLEFILFGNPHGGSQIMAENPVAALDLPLKIIVWEDSSHKRWIAYNAGWYFQKRYSLSPQLETLLNLDKLIVDEF